MRTLPSAVAGRDVPSWPLRKLVARPSGAWPPECGPEEVDRYSTLRATPCGSVRRAAAIARSCEQESVALRFRICAPRPTPEPHADQMESYGVIATRPACLAPRRRESVSVS